MSFEHISVMPCQVHDAQNLKPGMVCADCTLGGSGHALSTVQAIRPKGLLIGIDQDQDALANAEKVLRPHKDNVRLFHSNFSQLPRILTENQIAGVDSILLDLGFSLNQLTRSRRGFSFQKDDPLDMRMDTRNLLTAEAVVNTYSEAQLAKIFFTYGEERFSRRVAGAIVRHRAQSPIRTSKALAQLVDDAIPSKFSSKQKIHPATRVFQAVRIEVNQELSHLETFMSQVPDMLNPGGRISVISFHSLEDRIVKQSLRRFENGCTCPRELPLCLCGFVQTMTQVTRKPLMADDKERQANPMARSAKLRVAQRV